MTGTARLAVPATARSAELEGVALDEDWAPRRWNDKTGAPRRAVESIDARQQAPTPGSDENGELRGRTTGADRGSGHDDSPEPII